MSRLSDTQLVVLNAAVARDDRAIYPFPLRLKVSGGAVDKILMSLHAKGLIDAADRRAKVTDAAFAVLGIDDDAPAPVEIPGPKTKKRAPRKGRLAMKAETKAPRQARTGTKQARLIEMLKRAKGATIEEIVEELDWQPHTVRGAIAGALKKKLGLDVTSEKIDGRGRVYRLPA